MYDQCVVGTVVGDFAALLLGVDAVLTVKVALLSSPVTSVQ